MTPHLGPRWDEPVKDGAGCDFPHAILAPSTPLRNFDTGTTSPPTSPKPPSTWSITVAAVASAVVATASSAVAVAVATAVVGVLVAGAESPCVISTRPRRRRRRHPTHHPRGSSQSPSSTER